MVTEKDINLISQKRFHHLHVTSMTNVKQNASLKCVIGFLLEFILMLHAIT